MDCQDPWKHYDLSYPSNTSFVKFGQEIVHIHITDYKTALF